MATDPELYNWVPEQIVTALLPRADSLVAPKKVLEQHNAIDILITSNPWLIASIRSLFDEYQQTVRKELDNLDENQLIWIIEFLYLYSQLGDEFRIFYNELNYRNLKGL